ncbi:MAG: hypothetical protein ACLUUO_05790 [Sellimonas intestinalis]
MGKISEYTGIHLTISELSNSGIFNYVYEQGMIRYGINFMHEVKMEKIPDFSQRVYDSLLEEKVLITEFINTGCLIDLSISCKNEHMFRKPLTNEHMFGILGTQLRKGIK